MKKRIIFLLSMNQGQDKQQSIYNILTILNRKVALKQQTTVPQLKIQNQQQPNNYQLQSLQAPREISKKHYSLEADMITGWRPRKNIKINFNNVFPLNFAQQEVDKIVENLSRSKINTKYSIVYLGQRPQNSYVLHERRLYENPYPIDKKVQIKWPDRRQWVNRQKGRQSKLKFDSKFQCGNLDVAVEVSASEYDLFIRVDSNTKGHNNWFNFSIQNGNWIGQVQFNICNFRRELSLYQRNLRPYCISLKSGQGWKQVGKNVKYQRKNIRLSRKNNDDEQSESSQKHFNLSFTYEFKIANDKTQFAYCIPYSYSQLIKFLSTLSNVKQSQLCRSLSCLPIYMLQITDHQVLSENKKVVLVTSRIHPGQSNASYVVEGFLEFICGEDSTAKQLRRIYHFYVVPMMNPDGVVAGNYRTSLFGRDLNRTFNQSRKHAFPETYYLNQFVRELKDKEKQRFCLYIDFHGHSVKKNVFVYGPNFGINHKYYYTCRQLPKILSQLTPMFRYYSCSFQISNSKSTTARATFNQNYNIPFTYTLQTSNASYYDSLRHQQVQFTDKRWKQMGKNVCYALLHLKLKANHKILKELKINLFEKRIQQAGNTFKTQSDDHINEGKTDSQSSLEDLPMENLNMLEDIIGGLAKDQSDNCFITKTRRTNIKMNPLIRQQKLHSSLIEIKQKVTSKKANNTVSMPKNEVQCEISLPSIKKNQFLVNRTNKKKIITQQRLQNLSVIDFTNEKSFTNNNQLPIAKNNLFQIKEIQRLLDKKYGKFQLIKKTLKTHK